MNVNGFDSQRRQHPLKRRWQETKRLPDLSHYPGRPPSFMAKPMMTTFPCPEEDELVSTMVPPVTVVLDGRSICQRISLHKHASYRSLAKALRQMFVDGAAGDSGESTSSSSDQVATDIDLTNAVPGHLIAYEDIENDLLLAGDLNWNDFVRVAKRIRILPVPAKGREFKEGNRKSSLAINY